MFAAGQISPVPNTLTTMTNLIATAARILGHFWLEELTSHDVDLIEALPELAHTNPGSTAADLDALAVEYQRLFGFNLPPYESVFIDPSAMLLAPATDRVQHLYRQAGWTPPANNRAGAPDHLGLQLLALADWLEQPQPWAAHRLLGEHLALWAPPFLHTLTRLKPHPFYAALAELTLNLILSSLTAAALPAADPFPQLPPPPVFRGSGPDEFAPAPPAPDSPDDDAALRLRDVVKKLLPPRDTGLFLTREDMARLAQSLNLPVTVGDRFKMLETLFRQAGEFELLPQLFDQFNRLLDQTQADYHQWAAEYPTWQLYAAAWQQRLDHTKATLHDLADIAASTNW